MVDGNRDDNKRMNLEFFDKLMERAPEQQHSEWWIFIGICDMYLRRHKIENPIVVELGIYNNSQKVFYEQLFGAEHIGIDIRTRGSAPDIHGNSQDPKTLKALKEKLGGRRINILFIDASHWYEGVKKDFEMYSPLCDDIVAFHDTNYGRHRRKRANRQVWRFWDELKAQSPMGVGEYKNYLFISIDKTTGTGMMIRK